MDLYSFDKVIEAIDKLNLKPRLKEIRCSSMYLPTLLQKVQVGNVELFQKTLYGMYDGVPLIIDDSIETYKAVFYDREDN
jgi:hypothetical protein